MLSWTVNLRTLDEAAVLVEEGHRRGYRDFNIKSRRTWTSTSSCAVVRRAARDGFLWADANGGYDPATALHAARGLAEAGVDVLESPLRPNQLSGYQALRRLGPCRS